MIKYSNCFLKSIYESTLILIFILFICGNYLFSVDDEIIRFDKANKYKLTHPTHIIDSNPINMLLN